MTELTKISILLVASDPRAGLLSHSHLSEAAGLWGWCLKVIADPEAALAEIEHKSYHVCFLECRSYEKKAASLLLRFRERAASMSTVVLVSRREASLENLELGEGDERPLFLEDLSTELLRVTVQYAVRLNHYRALYQDAGSSLRCEEERTRQLLASITSILIVVRRDHVITHWNAVAERTFGISSAQIAGKQLEDCTLKWEQERVVQAILRCFETKASIKIEDLKYESPGGIPGLLGFTINPLTSREGSSAEVILLGADITERRRATEQLKAYTRELEDAKQQIENEKAKDDAILAGIGDGLIVTDENGRIILVNRQAVLMFGWVGVEVVGRDVWQAVPVNDGKGRPVDKAGNPIAVALATGKKVSLKGEACLDSRQRIPMQITASPVLLEDKIAGAVGIFRDISKERELDQAKSDFVSTVSHELRTPLTSVREGIAQVHEGILGPINNEQKEFLEISLEEVDRLAAIINDLLDISKIEAGKVVLKKAWVDVKEMVEQIAFEYRMVMKNKRIDLVTMVPEEDAEVFCDAGKIKQVVTNLLTNAYKFTPEGGRVTLELLNDAEHVSLAVRDTGVGISAVNLPKLFQKFVQIGRTAGPGIKGTGLGLTICKSLVEMHRGEIHATSELGKGTCFEFTLPKLAKDDAARENIEHGLDELVHEDSPLSLLVLRLQPVRETGNKQAKTLSQKILKKFLKHAQKAVLNGVGDIFLNGSHESIVILPGANKHKAREVAALLEPALHQVMEQLDGREEFKIDTGISCYPEDAATSELLLSKARGPAGGQDEEGKDRRQSLRTNYEMAISFCSEEGGPFEMHTIDISAGGAQLYGSCGMQVGVMYDVSMVLPGDFGRVDGRGVAVWVKQDKRGRRYMAGLQFVGMSDAARKKIERFVQSVLQAEDGEMKHPRMKKTA